MSKAQKILHSMETFLEAHQVSIEYGSGNFYGGVCTLNQARRIVVNRHIPVEEQIMILAKSFWDMQIDFDGLSKQALEFVMKFSPDEKAD
ncbi:MAG TPA: hypothetical protein ENN84_07485 [Candidatus Marinimicrobia bacterium]|nr:hypothetical protein [Candidatus Neomarinimicrobiota bacterium]